MLNMRCWLFFIFIMQVQSIFNSNAAIQNQMANASSSKRSQLDNKQQVQCGAQNCPVIMRKSNVSKHFKEYTKTNPNAIYATKSNAESVVVAHNNATHKYLILGADLEWKPPMKRPQTKKSSSRKKGKKRAMKEAANDCKQMKMSWFMSKAKKPRISPINSNRNNDSGGSESDVVMTEADQTNTNSSNRLGVVMEEQSNDDTELQLINVDEATWRQMDTVNKLKIENKNLKRANKTLKDELEGARLPVANVEQLWMRYKTTKQKKTKKKKKKDEHKKRDKEKLMDKQRVKIISTTAARLNDVIF
eukprot:964701_1